MAVLISATLLAMTNKQPVYPDPAFYTCGKEPMENRLDRVTVLQPSNVMFNTSKDTVNGVEL